LHATVSALKRKIVKILRKKFSCLAVLETEFQIHKYPNVLKLCEKHGTIQYVYTVKRGLAIFPSIILGQGEFGKRNPGWGQENRQPLFYSVV